MTSAVPDYIVGIAGGLGGAVGAVFTNPLEVSPKYSVHHQFSCTWNCGKSCNKNSDGKKIGDFGKK